MICLPFFQKINRERRKTQKFSLTSGFGIFDIIFEKADKSWGIVTPKTGIISIF